MLRKHALRVLVLAAFLLLPVMAHASPVTFVGGTGFNVISGSSTVPLGLALLGSFNVASDTTATTSFNLLAITLSNSTAPATYNLSFRISLGFSQPSVANVSSGLQFTAIGTQAGVTLSVTQTGAQNITLGGVNYFLTFNLSQMSLLPGQSGALISATLTPVVSVPEPATMLLLGTGLAGVAAQVRKRRKASKGEEA